MMFKLSLAPVTEYTILTLEATFAFPKNTEASLVEAPLLVLCLLLPVLERETKHLD